MEERKVSVSPLLGGITLTSQLKSPTLVLLPPIQTIKRLADHLSHSIDWIECVTYSRSDLFVFSGGDHSDFESLAQQHGGRGLPGQGDNRGAFLLKTYLPSNVNLKFQIWYYILKVPHTWTEMDCRTPLSMACLTPTNRKVFTFLCHSWWLQFIGWNLFRVSRPRPNIENPLLLGEFSEILWGEGIRMVSFHLSLTKFTASVHFVGTFWYLRTTVTCFQEKYFFLHMWYVFAVNSNWNIC